MDYWDERTRRHDQALRDTVARNVKTFRLEKPAGYRFEPGQATEVAINQDGWKGEKRPFTFTSLDDWPYPEFTNKSYDDHDGVTKRLGTLGIGDELAIPKQLRQTL